MTVQTYDIVGDIHGHADTRRANEPSSTPPVAEIEPPRSRHARHMLIPRTRHDSNLRPSPFRRCSSSDQPLARPLPRPGQFISASLDVLDNRTPDLSLAAGVAEGIPLQALELIESRISFRQGLVRPRGGLMCRVASTR